MSAVEFLGVKYARAFVVLNVLADSCHCRVRSNIFVEVEEVNGQCLHRSYILDSSPHATNLGLADFFALTEEPVTIRVALLLDYPTIRQLTL